MDDLPSEVLVEIFDRLPRHLLVDVVSRVCVRWRLLASAPFLWRRIELGREFDEEFLLEERFMRERGFDCVVDEFHLTMKNPFSDDAIEKLGRVLNVCRNIKSASFSVRLASTPTEQRRHFFDAILSPTVLRNLQSLTFNKGDWDNHEIYQTVDRFAGQLRRLKLHCHIPVAIETFPTMTSLRELDLDLNGLQQSGVSRVVGVLRQTLAFLHSLSLRSLSLFSADDFRCMFYIPTIAGQCTNLRSLSLSSFSIQFRFLGRHLFRLLPRVDRLSLTDVDLVEVLEAGENPFLYLPRSLQRFELTLNMARLNSFAGNVNDFAALYLMIYKPLADSFFQGVSKLEKLINLRASLILYEPCIFEWEMVHDIVPNADKIFHIEDRELKLSDFLMLCRRLNSDSWIFSAYRSLTVRIAESLTDETVSKLTKLTRRANQSKKLTMTLRGAIKSPQKLDPAYGNEDLETLLVYSSYAHRNEIDLFLADDVKLKSWRNLVELRMFGVHASPTSQFLSRLTPLLTRLRRLDLSCPGGLPPGQLITISVLTELEEANIAVSLYLFGKEVEEVAATPAAAAASNFSSSSSFAFFPFDGPKFSSLYVKYLDGSNNAAISTHYQDPDRLNLFRDAFVEFFCFHFPFDKLDFVFPHLRSLKVPLHGSRGVANFSVARDCLDRLVSRQSWKSVVV